MPAVTMFSRYRFSISFFSAAIYGGLIELYQGFILSNRTADWVDFLANCIGAIIGMMLSVWLFRKG